MLMRNAPVTLHFAQSDGQPEEEPALTTNVTAHIRHAKQLFVVPTHASARYAKALGRQTAPCEAFRKASSM
jgi:hypothetical protein